MIVAIIQIIIGSILWFLIVSRISKHFVIFASPLAWVISWIVCIGIVMNIGYSIRDSVEYSNISKEARKIQGAYKSSDGKYIGIRATDEEGGAVRGGDNGFIVAFYDEDNNVDMGAVLYPKNKKAEIIHAGESDYHDGSYKYSGIFSKKLVIKQKDNDKKYVYTKKSKVWDKYIKK